ncbi:hypothetical protein ACIRST_14625 [Kitasatospora sp. NPDC101447]|uniref:hypothetical protein n=1 Tax=Kitasatospora sp. NPDC101447 TaxID=3364102 RepID=UPI003804AD9B
MRKDVGRFAELAGVSCDPSEPVLPWARSREEVGFEFPADYREFIDTFGPGDLRGYLHVGAPWTFHGSPQAGPAFRQFLRSTTDDLGPVFRGMRQDDPALCPYPFLPEPGGLLCWGATVQGDHFFWLTSDPDPMEWPVVVWFRGQFPKTPWRKYEMRFVAFLLHALSGADRDLHDLLDWPAEPIWRRTSEEDHRG